MCVCIFRWNNERLDVSVICVCLYFRVASRDIQVSTPGVGNLFMLKGRINLVVIEYAGVSLAMTR